MTVYPLDWLVVQYDTRPFLLVGLAVFVILTLWSCVWLNRFLKAK